MAVGIGAALALIAHEACAVHAAKPAACPLREVVVVFKTHFDIGYTNMARDVLEYYRTAMIDRALAVCDATHNLPPEQRFVWTLPGWPLAQIIGPQQAPERRERILAAMREGRFVWHALPATTHTESLDLEDLVRGLRFSSGLSRSLGQPLPRDAKMTDVPSHAWALPTVLAGAGVEFMHVGCNRASSPPETPLLFWWEGPDGSRVMTMLTASYGSDLVPPKDWPHTTWLALIHTGDNAGPPRPEQVKELLGRAAKELPGVKVRFGRLSDFADAILKESPTLPVIRADMPDTWIHGIMAMPIETAIARRTRPLIGTLESLHTLLRAWGANAPDPKDTVARAYEQSLLYGEHTWGMDVKKFGPRLYDKAWEEARAKGTYAKLEESWAEHGGYARQAADLVSPAIRANMQGLAQAVSGAGPRVIVFNPLPYPRDDVVTADWPGPVPKAVRPADQGSPTPVQAEGRTIRFLAEAMPPMGYRTYVPTETAVRGALSADESTATIENGLVRIRLDAARGVIASWLDKQHNRELVAECDGAGLGQYVYERFDADDAKAYLHTYSTLPKMPWAEGDFGKPGLPPAKDRPHAIASPKGSAIKISAGPVSATATMTAAPSDDIPHGISLAVTIYTDHPWVDLTWTIHDKKPTPWPEAGWLCVPVHTTHPSFQLGRLGAIIDPARDGQSGANRDVYCLNTGMIVTGQDGAGVGLCPLDSPLVCLGERRLWKYSRDYVPNKPVVYVHLFNNLWSTNFQQWVGGSWSSRVRLWAVPHGSGSQAAWLVRNAWEARRPCLAAYAAGAGGVLPTAQAGLQLSRRDVLVTAFGPNPDGPGTLLRLWEQAGADGACRVELPAGFPVARARPCDLRGRIGGKPIPIRDGTFEVFVKRFAPVSLILEGDVK